MIQSATEPLGPLQRVEYLLRGFSSMYQAKTEDTPSFYQVFITNLMILFIYQSFLT